MALLTYCISCQYGDHDGHYEIVQAVPEGVIGGAICKCRGECKDFPQQMPSVDAQIPGLPKEVEQLLERIKDEE